MTPESHKRIVEAYVQYCEVVKPLIARIEALSEKMPIALFNEIRAFNDHIARCYYSSPSDSYIQEQINKADRHIARMTLDCFKCLNVILFQKIEQFEHDTRHVDLTVIDNGLFYPEYCRRKTEAAECILKAKTVEGNNLYDSLILFEKASNIYSEVVESIARVSEIPGLPQAKSVANEVNIPLSALTEI